MKLCVLDHQGKSDYLRARLLEHGHSLGTVSDCDVLLIDQEWSDGPRATIRAVHDRGGYVICYGHGMPPLQASHGRRGGNEYVDAMLVPTAAHAALYEWCGERRMIVCGWHYCATVDPVYAPVPGPLVFAPIHTHSGGYEWQWQEAANARTLAQLPEDVTVSDAPEGRRVDEALAVIDAARVVVASGTFAYLAVARGRPTVFFGQNGDTMPFPLDMSDWPIEEPWAYREPVAAWREAMIGPPFDPSCLDFLA